MTRIMSAEVTAPALPPVIVRTTGPGGEVRAAYLNIGVDAANAVHMTAPAPGPFTPTRTARIMSMVSVGLVPGIAVGIYIALSADDALTAAVVGLSSAAVLLGVLGVAVARQVAVRRSEWAVTAWRARVESAVNGHREQLVKVSDLKNFLQYPDVQKLILSLEETRERVLNAGDGHDKCWAQPELLNALAALGRYATDLSPDRGRINAARDAAARFDQAAAAILATTA